MKTALQILFVEDSEDDLLLILRTLSKAGFDVKHKRVDTQEGMLTALESDSWDLVISDFSMPRFTGFAALSALKKNRPDIPFLLVSGVVGEETAVEAMLAGASDYILKDNLTRLPLAVAREIQLRHERQEQRNVKEKVGRLEEKLWSVIERVPDVLWSALHEGPQIKELSFISPTCKDLYEYTPQDFYRRPLLRLETVIEEDRPKVLGAWMEASESDQKILLNYRIRTRAGDVRWIEDVITSTRDTRGETAVFHGISRDTTERWLLEEALKMKDNQLRHAQKLEAVGLLAGGIAHDFNNVAAAVGLYADSALDKTEADHPVREDLSQISKAIDRASALTRQLLFFSRKQPVHPRVLDANQILSDLLKMLRRLIEPPVELSTRFDPELWKIRADSGQLEQVIVNLSVNARDAMLPKGGKAEISTRNEKLLAEKSTQSGVLKPGDYVILEVTDQGSGMSPETVLRVFEPFFTTKGEGKGTGLGLSTVYGIVQSVGGQIEIWSEVGTGTRFTVYLPRTESSEEKEAPAKPETGSLNGTETILLVEDDSIVRRGVQRGLLNHGYHVLEASNGEEALKILEGITQPIQLMISDIMMARIGGLDLAARIQSLLPNIKVIFMSGSEGTHTEILETTKNDQIRYLPKPFRLETLLHAVRDSLD